jgi:hypothetical protein
MNLLTEPYLAQTARLPKTGRHIQAHFDDDSVIMYQAYSPASGILDNGGAIGGYLLNSSGEARVS